MNDKKLLYLQALGITPWISKHQTIAPTDTSEWEALQAQIAHCTECALHETRTHTVFGTGNPQAEIMFIGEAPGFNEDQQGKPFVGRAGQLLTAMLQAIDKQREDVFIANILKCRPPNNRDPLANEVATCTPYLARQIACIKPRLLVALGRIAAHHLLQTKASLESLRGKVHLHEATHTPLIVTYHPAYLLRNLIDKKKAYADLLFIESTLKSQEEAVHGSISSPTRAAL